MTVGNDGSEDAYELPPEFAGLPNFDRLLSDRRDRGRALLDALLLTGDDELLTPSMRWS